MFNFFEKKPGFLLWIGLIFMIISPIIFTNFHILNFLDFSDKGQIGDTIGGITSPIINFIGSLLIYFAFKAQVSANKIQTDTLKAQLLANENLEKESKHNNALKEYEQINILIEESKNLTKELNYENKNGVDAFNKFVFEYLKRRNNLDSKIKKFMKDLCYILETLDFAALKISSMDYSEEYLDKYKNFNRTRFLHFYSLQLEDEIKILKGIPEINNAFDKDYKKTNPNLTLIERIAKHIGNIEEILDINTKSGFYKSLKKSNEHIN